MDHISSPSSTCNRGQVQAIKIARNGPFFGGRIRFLQAEGTSENGRYPRERSGNVSMYPWALRLDWKKGAGNELSRERDTAHYVG